MQTEQPQPTADKDVRQVFGHAVRDARMGKGWTQETLAERLNARGLSITQTMVAKVERGARPTPVEEVAVIAEVLGVPVGNLFTPGGTAADLRELRSAVQEMGFAANKLGDAAGEYETAREVLQDEIDKATAYVQTHGEGLSRREIRAVNDLLDAARSRARTAAPELVEKVLQQTRKAKEAFLNQYAGD